MKQAILIVAVGAATSQGQNGLAAFRLRVEAAFPDLPVRLALASERVRSRLARQGKKSDSVEKALLKLHYEKFSHVAVQPLYSLAGVEYEEIARTVADFRLHCPDLNIVVGRPLLACPGAAAHIVHQAGNQVENRTGNLAACADNSSANNSSEVESIASALLNSLPLERKPDEPIIWMGHGSRYAADDAYAMLAKALRRRDPLAFVATMDGAVNLDSVLQFIRADRNSLDLAPQVWLLPLLSIIGRHALEDMAGDNPDSWKSLLEARGFRVRVVLAGLAENEAIAAMWIQRLAEALGMQ